MEVLLLIAFLLIGALLNFFLNPKIKFVYGAAKCNILLAIFLSIVNACYLLCYLPGTNNAILLKIFHLLLYCGGLLWYLIFGYLITNIFFELRLKDASEDNYRLAKTIWAALWAISILKGSAFIIVAIGIMGNFAQMTAFFTTSGYAIWFLYFIIIAEALPALPVLLHYKLKTGIMAAAGLMLIMIGALYTHCYHKDPFSDSYAAMSQFITLSLLQVIYYFEKQVNAKPEVLFHTLNLTA